MMTGPAAPDPATFFTTDPQDGALRDANGDGIPDRLRVRLLLVDRPSADEWLALLDLAARLGLESGGLDLPLAVSSSAVRQADVACLAFLPASGTAEPPIGARWLLRGAAEVRTLCRAGFEAVATSEYATTDAATSNTSADLARFYAVGGALADDDDGLIPARIRLCPIVPPDLPVEIGASLLDLAARLGLESTGVRFPLGIAAGAPPPPDTMPLTIALSLTAKSTTLRPGEGRCEIVAGPRGQDELRVSGDPAGVAVALRALADTWPNLDRWAADAPTVGDLTDELTATLLGETAAGRAAILTAALDQATAKIDPRGEVRVLLDEPAAARVAQRWQERKQDRSLIIAPDDRLAFVEEWRGEWEIDRARRTIADRVLPALDPSAPAELTILVSEPPAIRAALATEIGALLPPGSTVQVLSAFKAALSWLTEFVGPRWQRRGDVARIVIAFRSFEPGDEQFLDLVIRPLQELYPGDELLAAALGLPLTAIALEADPAQMAEYVATAYDTEERTIDTLTFSARRYRREYLTGHPAEGFVTVATGAIVAQQGGLTIFDERLPTDVDQIWDHYQTAVLPRLRETIVAETGGAITPEAQPFFAALEIDAWVSESDEPLGVREELFSSAEALHQDFYFGTLDAIAALGGAPPTSGTLDGGKGGGALDAPGAIRPFIHLEPGRGPRLRVALRRRLRHLAEVITPSGRVALGQLPVGARPHVVVRAFHARAGESGIGALQLAVLDNDAVYADTLHALAAQGRPAEARTIDVAVGEAHFAIALPLAQPATELPDEATALKLPAEALDHDTMEPHLARLAALPGVTVRTIGRSFEGRPLAAIELHDAPRGTIWSRHKANLYRPTVLIIARHHANEPASTHAALTLAARWATDPVYHDLRSRINIAILPLENPDGAALHAAMRREHPTWKHHVARYNAVGREFARDYFDPETPWGEARARPRLWREWLPDVVIDNHGVPSHEWNQHFNGFGSPPRFGVSYWLVSALLYGILRYPTADPAHATAAEVIRERVAVAVAADKALAAGNAAAHAVYERWGHRWLPERFPATYHREMLWYFGPQAATRFHQHRPASYDRLTVADVVTEVPDETAQGDYLALVAHAHLVANEALLALLADSAPPLTRSVATTPDGVWLRLTRPRPLRL